MTIHIPRTKDFHLTGDGSSPAWEKSPWLEFTRVGGHADYLTRGKLLYSHAGIYVLYDCQDERLTCDSMKDFDDLYLHDVAEVFFWTDRRQPLYFEHEISPLDKELVLLVPNLRRVFHGWRAWHYDGERRTRHATAVRGGKRRAGAKVEGWSAEVFVPFQLLVALGNVPPKPGTLWRGNLCRIDRDHGRSTYWSLSPKTGVNFHDYRSFSTLRFE